MLTNHYEYIYISPLVSIKCLRRFSVDCFQIKPRVVIIHASSRATERWRTARNLNANSSCSGFAVLGTPRNACQYIELSFLQAKFLRRPKFCLLHSAVCMLEVRYLENLFTSCFAWKTLLLRFFLEKVCQTGHLSTMLSHHACSPVHQAGYERIYCVSKPFYCWVRLCIHFGADFQVVSSRSCEMTGFIYKQVLL
ncbi:hypothetical protein KAFR_0G00350 [Kazachstania africana CBS 2517]|uniref:Uncharacterized protein n=1 Tax=Kazachstania africana (strain ATCC 22294 / BCRC 22015 / CBS 2517 / CECT 1963 / NBRC 1671 / NRRL Y-8276) TaxID=1071382 RepID=H2AXG8_KAZAF|nr:hypothetical protein KAFR_0G00350 [Kazachstania africana CBS 2517]CCF59068.1 hypothetical protein KAFR_0G00350 [Kazachstania africana CBS 2517]